LIAGAAAAFAGDNVPQTDAICKEKSPLSFVLLFSAI